MNNSVDVCFVEGAKGGGTVAISWENYSVVYLVILQVIKLENDKPRGPNLGHIGEEGGEVGHCTLKPNFLVK